MKIAVLGAGISGLSSAYILSKKHQVDLYEKDDRFGGHARTTQVTENGKNFGVDTGFLVFNNETYPLLTKLFEQLDVKIEKSDMSFSFWNKTTNNAYNGESLKGLFFQKKNLLSLSHYKMINDIIKFNKKANKDLQNDSFELDKSLGEYIKNFSAPFKQRYLIPMGASIWSTPSNKMNEFPARTFLNFFKNHGLLGVNTHHQWLTVSNGSINYVEKILEKISGKCIKNSGIKKIRRLKTKVELIFENDEILAYDKVVLAMHAPDALELLADATTKEKEILSAFKFKKNYALLHNDNSILYPNRDIYAAWNYKSDTVDKNVTLTYWINRLQNIKSHKDYFVSLNEFDKTDNAIEKIEYSHPQFDINAINMQKHKEQINGVNHTYYAGAYWRYGFHEDGLYSAVTIGELLGCKL